MTSPWQVRVKSPVASLLLCNLPRCETTWVVAKFILISNICSYQFNNILNVLLIWRKTKLKQMD